MASERWTHAAPASAGGSDGGAVDRVHHRAVIVRQEDGPVGAGSTGSRRARRRDTRTLKSVNFRPFAVEITTTRSLAARSAPRATSLISTASATPVCGQLNMPVRSARAGGVGELLLGRLLDDAVVLLQRADRLLHRHRDCRSGSPRPASASPRPARTPSCAGRRR